MTAKPEFIQAMSYANDIIQKVPTFSIFPCIFTDAPPLPWWFTYNDMYSVFCFLSATVLISLIFLIFITETLLSLHERISVVMYQLIRTNPPHQIGVNICNSGQWHTTAILGVTLHFGLVLAEMVNLYSGLHVGRLRDLHSNNIIAHRKLAYRGKG